MVTHNHNDPSFKNVWISQSQSYIEILLHCLPLKLLIIVPLPLLSRSMKELDIYPLKYVDLLQYSGLWILMSTCSGWKREDFWSVAHFDQEENPCPYCLGEFMYKCHFNAITREPRFTNTNTPPYADTIRKILHMVKVCNDHITSILLTSWEIFLYEPTSIYHILCTCPGWILCPQKLHQFGNEWHTTCCAFSGILFVVNLV